MTTSAEILSPELIWVDGRCYRTNDSTFAEEKDTYEEQDLYEYETIVEDEGDDDDDDFEVTKIDESRYSISFHVPKFYQGSLIGRKGVIKQQLERDTKTEIKIPKQSQNGDIVIYGPSAASVKAAGRRINIIVMSTRFKQRATHFISIPMNSPDIQEQYLKFKESVLHDCANSRDLDETLFIKPYKLHITCGVMSLMDQEERMQASQLLTEAKETIIMPILKENLPLKLRLKGLSYMNDDPKDIDVLYGEVQVEEGPTDLLQHLADRLVEHYSKAGFMDVSYEDHVKLHVTLINSKYRRGSSTSVEESKPRQRHSRLRLSFDGSLVLQKFADYDFGVMDVKEIHLSQCHSGNQGSYYQSTCVVNLD